MFQKRFPGLQVKYNKGNPGSIRSYNVGQFGVVGYAVIGVEGYAVKEANLNLLRFCVETFSDCDPWTHWCLQQSLWWLFRRHNSTIVSYLIQTIPQTKGDLVMKAWEDINHIMEGFLTGGSSQTGGFEDWPARIKEVIPQQLFLWLDSKKIKEKELEELFQIKHEQQLFVLGFVRPLLSSFITVKPLVQMVLDYLCCM